MFGKSKQEKLEEKLKRQFDKSRELVGVHMAGLPLAQDVWCDIKIGDDYVEIIGSGNTFKLDLAKITDMQGKTDVDIQKQYSSSAGGAVAGAMVFGPLGAIIGGRAKKKTTQTLEHYFIITYQKDGAPAYISFRVADKYAVKVMWIEQYYQTALQKPAAVIDL